MKAKPKSKAPARKRAPATKATPAPVKPASLVERIVGRFLPELSGHALLPLIVLFGLNLVDEFDIQAFSILGPEIRDAFGLTTTELASIRTAAALPGLLVPFIGFFGDRRNRVRMSGTAAVVWGIFALATGLVPAAALGLLYFARMGSGTAKLVNFPVHTSLLFDYYPARSRGRVFGFYRSADGVAALLGPAIAGLVAWQLGWRWAFFLLAIPTFLLVLVALRLREPVRGESENRDAAIEAAEEPAIQFGRAVRWLYSIPTLKRIFVGAFCTGLGGIAYAVLFPIFLEDVFGVSEVGRGIIASSAAPFGLLGLWLSGRITDQWQRTKTMAHVTLLFGAGVAGLGVTLALVALAPTLWSVVVINFAVGFFLAVWLPPYLMITGLVSPARIRSLGLSYAGFFFTLGIIGTIPVAAIEDANGPRWALFTAAVVLAVGGLVHASAAKFANADIDRSFKVLQTEANLRYQRVHDEIRALLLVQQVDVAYDDTQVLFGVDFEVQQGELVALLGTNGAGKSTLLKAVSGLVHPRAGSIYFDGKDITHLEPEETAAEGIILMPGGKSIFPTLTVKENLDMAAWLYDKDREYVEGAKKRVVDIFPILGERADQQAGSLSGGEQQMLSLAQAFIAKPRLLMIDELSLGLAPIIVQQLLSIVEEIHRNGTTVVLVEQSVNVALTVAKHAYFMEKGEIRFNGSTNELLKRRDILRSVFLEGASSVTGNGRRR